MQNLIVVSPQTIDAFYHEHIPRLEQVQQPLIFRTVEVLSGLSVTVDIPIADAKCPQRNNLSFLVLVLG